MVVGWQQMKVDLKVVGKCWKYDYTTLLFHRYEQAFLPPVAQQFQYTLCNFFLIANHHRRHHHHHHLLHKKQHMQQMIQSSDCFTCVQRSFAYHIYRSTCFSTGQSRANRQIIYADWCSHVARSLQPALSSCNGLRGYNVAFPSSTLGIIATLEWTLHASAFPITRLALKL